MKISINDQHENYVFLTQDEIFHDLTLNGVNWNNLDLFMRLLDFFVDNKEAFASWIRTGWMNKKDTEKEFRENIFSLLMEIDEQNYPI